MMRMAEQLLSKGEVCVGARDYRIFLHTAKSERLSLFLKKVEVGESYVFKLLIAFSMCKLCYLDSIPASEIAVSTSRYECADITEQIREALANEFCSTDPSLAIRKSTAYVQGWQQMKR